MPGSPPGWSSCKPSKPRPSPLPPLPNLGRCAPVPRAAEHTPRPRPRPRPSHLAAVAAGHVLRPQSVERGGVELLLLREAGVRRLQQREERVARARRIGGRQHGELPLLLLGLLPLLLELPLLLLHCGLPPRQLLLLLLLLRLHLGLLPRELLGLRFHLHLHHLRLTARLLHLRPGRLLCLTPRRLG